MIGKYFATTIVVAFHQDKPGWSAHTEFVDGGFMNDDADTDAVSTEGVLRTRYAVRDGEARKGLSAAIDAIIADAQRMGIEFRSTAAAGPFIWYEGDGEDDNHPAPEGWREMLTAEAERLGWSPTYATTER